jgi:hypothetical protein
MRTQVLNRANRGINRQRIKGGAPEDALYDLQNGFVTQSATVKSRPGTVEVVALPEQTKGLMAFDQRLLVFSHVPSTPTNPLFETVVIVDPNAVASPIAAIHFAAAYLGVPYVVAEFESGNLYHFWLVPGVEWEPDTPYQIGDYVVPTTPNGFTYRATRLGDPAPVWAPDVLRALNDVIEPTVPNGYKYTAIETVGDTPRSGKVEPIWPAYDLGTVVEDVDLGPPAAAPIPGDTNPDQDNPGGSLPVPGPIRDRYPPGNRRQQ